MRLPHVQMELPKIGVTKRLPMSSSAITANPDVKTCMRSRRPELLIDTLEANRVGNLIRFRREPYIPRSGGNPTRAAYETVYQARKSASSRHL